MATMQQAYPRLLEALQGLRQAWKSHQILSGALLTGAVSTGGLLSVIVADNLFAFGPFGRVLLAAALALTVLSGVLAFVVKRWLEDRRDDYFAALVERRFPDLNNRFINALQLGRGNQDGHSPRLIQAIIHDAANAVADRELEQSVDRQPTKRAAGVALSIVFLTVLYGVVFTPYFVNGAMRVLAPWADIPPYTRTRVPTVQIGVETVTFDDQGIERGREFQKVSRIAEGSSLIVTAQTEGELPDRAEVRWRSLGGDWKSPLAMQPQAGGHTFRAVLPPIGESIELFVIAGDGRSKMVPVEVVQRPVIDTVTAEITLPVYVGGEPRSVKADVEAIPGSNVALTFRASKPIQRAWLMLETTRQGKKEITRRLLDPIGSDANQRQAAFFLWDGHRATPKDTRGLDVIQAPARYQIVVQDSDGFFDTEDKIEGSTRRLWRSIHTIPDERPSVGIPEPGQDRQVKPNDVITLQLAAEDDYGLDDVRIVYRLNADLTERELVRRPAQGAKSFRHSYRWDLSALKLKSNDVLVYKAVARDRNTLTGPGQGESQSYKLQVVVPEERGKDVVQKVGNYVDELAELVRRQRDNRARTFSGAAFVGLIEQQSAIRKRTQVLARAMESEGLPLATMVKQLDALAAGLMARAIKQLETGRDRADQATAARDEAVQTQDAIIAELEAMLARLQRNEQARKTLAKIAKTDKANFDKLVSGLVNLIKKLDAHVKDSTELVSKFERLPKKATDPVKEEKFDAAKALEDFKNRTEKWHKESVNEMSKLPTGFIDDFQARKDVNKIFEEVEKAAHKNKAEKFEVSLEDLGAGLAEKMKEDLEMWLPDAADSAKWVQEEPKDNKRMKIPEMPLPKNTTDIVGDLLQKAEEFDEEADDVTSAWGDNLDQAGWGVSDGPISTFSAKGKTGNDQPNSQELTGRSGDGRRGKSSGQMVGDASRGLPGRKTPARVGNERYEPGKLKNEGSEDPMGATGGGKKASAGRRGLQGGTPPDPTKDIGRLTEKQAGLVEQAKEVARRLEKTNANSTRIRAGLKLLEESEQDWKNRKYEDAARKRKEAIKAIQSARDALDGTTARSISTSRDLPPELRQELLQGADDGYPPGYESLLKSYYKALSQDK